MSMRYLRRVTLVLVLILLFALTARAQAPQLIFTTPLPERPLATPLVETSVVVEERALALWGGATDNFGTGVTVSSSHWTLRSVLGMTDVRIDGSPRPTFQQIELARPVWSRGSTTVAAGGGVRQEWDGAPVFIGRINAGSDVGGGRLQGSLVVEHASSSAIVHDAADMITTMGWSRRIRDGIGFGVEGIGQDLEGFWNPREVDGGAKMLVGPSVHVRSTTGAWTASLVAGPVFHAMSSTSHAGFFVSASWIPTTRHRTRE
jgi:hypothetical protein